MKEPITALYVKTVRCKTTVSSEMSFMKVRFIQTTNLIKSTFKKRYGGHKSSFANEKRRHDTTLSTEFWRLKEMNKNPHDTWKVVETLKAFKLESNKCQHMKIKKIH